MEKENKDDKKENIKPSSIKYYLLFEQVNYDCYFN